MAEKLLRAGRMLLIMVLGLAGATLTGYFFRWMDFPDTNIVVVYIFSVLLIARFAPGYGYGAAVSVAATLTFNYFFTAPYFTLDVYDPSYLVTFAVMTVTAAVTSGLTSRARKNEKEAREKERVANALYHLTHRLTDAADLESIQRALVEEVGRTLDCTAACLCFDEKGCAMDTYLEQKDGKQIVRRTGEEEKRKYSGGFVFAKDTISLGRDFADWPIWGKDGILGVLRIPKEIGMGSQGSYVMLVKAMLENAALAMERVWNVQESNRSREEAAQERYRGNLLRAISHDLRTPLAGIMGSCELLLDRMKEDTEGEELVNGIYKDADWLLSLVENILNLTRLQDGRLVLHKEAEAVEEVVGSAVAHITKRYPKREVGVQVPEEFLLIQMDARLIEQVLVNLLDNAVKHTKSTEEVFLKVEFLPREKRVVFRVMDSGSGINPVDLPHIFELFYTSSIKSPDAKRGVGLGLAICESIVKMHGGSITARNRIEGKGAEFVFELPIEKQGTPKENRPEKEGTAGRPDVAEAEA